MATATYHHKSGSSDAIQVQLYDPETDAALDLSDAATVECKAGSTTLTVTIEDAATGSLLIIPTSLTSEGVWPLEIRITDTGGALRIHPSEDAQMLVIVTASNWT